MIGRLKSRFVREPLGVSFTRSERILKSINIMFLCLGAVGVVISLVLALPPRFMWASAVLAILGFGEYFFIRAEALERKLKILIA